MVPQTHHFLCRGCDAMETTSIVCAMSAGVLIGGCAGPPDPSLDLGPGFDSFAGFAFLALLIALAWKPLKRALGPRMDTLSPTDIVKRRYAQGELSEGEYLRMMENLAQSKANFV
jgi:hypothetical protein